MHHNNLLARERKTWALTQEEVGLLVGLSDDAIGNYELGERLPGLLIALGLEVIFGTSLRVIFADARKHIASEIVKGSQILSKRVEALSDPASERKKQLLNELGERLRTILPHA